MSHVLAKLAPLLSHRLIGTAMAWAIMYQVAICGFTLPGLRIFLVCCLVLPILFATAPVYGLGRLVAAWWVRYSLLEVAAFGVAVRRVGPDGAWRLRQTPSPDFPPAVTALARDGADIRRRHQTFVFSGMLALALGTILCLVAGQALYSSEDGIARLGFRPPLAVAFLFPNTLLIAALNLGVIAGAGFALSCLVLAEPGAPPGFGNHVLHLLREPYVERDIGLSNLLQWMLFGVRPRDWEAGLVEMLHEPGSAGTEVRAALFLFYYHEDRGEVAVAQRHLRRAVELCGEGRPALSAVAVEAAYVAGLHHRDGVTACDWLAQVEPGEVEPHTLERAQAAVLLAEGQFGPAIAMAEQGLASSRKSGDPGGAEAERRCLQAIIDASRQGLDAPPSVPLSTRD